MEPKPLVILTHVCHAAVTEGFLPAAAALALPVVLLTDHRAEHLEYFSRRPEHAPLRIIECDVFNPLGVIDVLRGLHVEPAAVFSNSDHLQACAASVAEGLGLPGKAWRICYAAKNKAAMRERLRELGLPTPWFRGWAEGEAIPDDAPFPVIAKPREGVASLDVELCRSAEELRAYGERFWSRHPGRAVLLESFLEGPLFTLETLGDGRRTRAVGGFDVRLSEPPYFVEMEAIWNGPVGVRHRDQALAQVLAFGVDFGVCHSEFVLTSQGPVLIEINYRSIGDGREFILDQIFQGRWFEQVLRLHLGQPLDLPSIEPRHALVKYYVATEEGTLAQASPSATHELDGAHITYRSLRNAGDVMRLTRSNKDYLGALSIVAADQNGLLRALSTIEPDLHWDVRQHAAERLEAVA